MAVPHVAVEGADGVNPMLAQALQKLALAGALRVWKLPLRVVGALVGGTAHCLRLPAARERRGGATVFAGARWSVFALELAERVRQFPSCHTAC